MQSLKLKLSFASFNLLSLPFLQLQWHLHADLQCPMDSQDTGDLGTLLHQPSDIPQSNAADRACVIKGQHLRPGLQRCLPALSHREQGAQDLHRQQRFNGFRGVGLFLTCPFCFMFQICEWLNSYIREWGWTDGWMDEAEDKLI